MYSPTCHHFVRPRTRAQSSTHPLKSKPKEEKKLQKKTTLFSCSRGMQRASILKHCFFREFCYFQYAIQGTVARLFPPAGGSAPSSPPAGLLPHAATLGSRRSAGIGAQVHLENEGAQGSETLRERPQATRASALGERVSR